MRPGLSGTSKMQLVYGGYPGDNGGPPSQQSSERFPCPKSTCLANPVIQTVSALPSGTSAPNTVLAEHAVHQLGLPVKTSGWLIQTAHPLTAAQLNSARLTAAGAGMTVEARSSVPGVGWLLAGREPLAIARQPIE
jgi:hypothetical protein